MVRQCYVCRKLDYLNRNLSFHKFPTNSGLEKLWLSLLGLEEQATVRKTSLICSSHFNPEDLITRNHGRFLRKNATPIPFYAELNLPLEKQFSAYVGSDSTVEDSPPRRVAPRTCSAENQTSLTPGPSRTRSECNNEESDEECTSTITLSSNEMTNIEKIPGSPRRVNLPKEGILEFSSSTLTASETENEIVHMIKKGSMKKMSLVGHKSGFKGKLSLLADSKKRKRQIETSSEESSTPPKLRKKYKFIKATVTDQKKKIKVLQQSVRRLKARVTNLNSLIKLLRQRSYIPENSEETIKASLSEIPGELFVKLLKGPKKQKYTPALRSFALTLNFYSAKAYNFVRKTFNKTLPHPVTISRWYQSIDGSPGWTKEALNTLKLKVAEAREVGKTVVCNLVLDEMSIRKQVEWTGKRFCGYVDFGTKLEGDVLPEAKEVLVFMLVSLNCSWKIPIGYFLLDGISASEKAALVENCLKLTADTGVQVSSLTFDGAPANLRMVVNLGCDFSNVQSLKTYFLHPVTKEKVFVFLDACHMLKLIRNCLGSQRILEDPNKEQINWSYLVKLVDIQYSEGLHAATKIKKRHLEWTREKMKVKIATQTFSKSVADSLLFLCKDIKHKDFENCEATAYFIKMFNDLFDIFNSRNRFAKYFYKKPLSPSTAKDFFQYLDGIKDYITNIRLNSLPVVQSPRKTGFLGFLICMQSLKDFYELYVVKKMYLKYILTYKLSQDHLELFFGAIRSRGGFNNNPTARQFEAAYKRLIVHSQIKAGDTGNVINLDSTSILFCSSSGLTTNHNGENLQQDPEYVRFEDNLQKDIEKYNYIHSSAWDLTDYVQDIVAYIAGFIIKSLKKIVTCYKCIQLIEADDALSELQKRKQFKNLTKASVLVIKICHEAEKYFRFFHKTTDIFNRKIQNLNNLLITNTMKNFSHELFDYFGDHLYDDDPVDGHSIKLIKLILEKYFKIRIHYESVKKIDYSMDRVRSVLTKTILFKNQ